MYDDDYFSLLAHKCFHLPKFAVPFEDILRGLNNELVIDPATLLYLNILGYGNGAVDILHILHTLTQCNQYSVLMGNKLEEMSKLCEIEGNLNFTLLSRGGVQGSPPLDFDLFLVICPEGFYPR